MILLEVIVCTDITQVGMVERETNFEFSLYLLYRYDR
jgi:hypothetical protein